MNTRRILLAYATKYGSTQEVAQTIATTLREAGLEVEMRPMREVKSLDGYEAVVLGAALYGSRWHPEAHLFLSQHQATLRQRPVAMFALGPLNTSAAAKQRSRHQLDKDLEKYPWLKPVTEEMFAGKYDPSQLSLFERLIPASDHRDWNAIRAWASALPAQLAVAEIPYPA